MDYAGGKLTSPGFYNFNYYLAAAVIMVISLELINFAQNLKQLKGNELKTFKEREKKIAEFLEKNMANITKEETEMWGRMAKENVDYLEYSIGPGVLFFIKEMNEDKLHQWSCKYIRYWLFLKMVLFEFIITSMQMLPTAQIVIMIVCQLLSILWLIHALFIGKIFAAWYHAIGDVFIELTLMLFLGMGFLNNVTGVTDKSLEIKYVNLQVWLIYLILVTTAVLVV